MADKNESKKWQRHSNPPPPMFFGEKERDLVKQVTDEITERVVGQRILYYSIDIGKSNFHSVYGESIEKSFLPPIFIHAFVSWTGMETETTNYGIDRRAKIQVGFHKRRLTEDQDLYVREGDFIQYGNAIYEITTLNEPRELFGQTQYKVEIVAECIQARNVVFDGK